MMKPEVERSINLKNKFGNILKLSTCETVKTNKKQ